MSSNYSIIIDKGERHEYCVRHIFRYLLSGSTSTFNFSIERAKDGCDTVTEVLEGYPIQNATENYNNMLAAKEWTKTDPKVAKIIALTAH